MKKYDYLIVGAGLFGAVFAHDMTKDFCLFQCKKSVFHNFLL